MITPRLLRRSFRRALQWRFLLLWLVLVAVPAAAALFPVWRFLDEHLGRSPRAQELVAFLDSHAVADLVKRLIQPRAVSAMAAGAWSGALLVILCMPAGAGAAIALARAEEPLGFRALLAGVAEHYGRMLRMLLVSVLPLGLAAAAAAGLSHAAVKAAEHATLESHAIRNARSAAIAGSILFFAAQITVDAGRAAFAAAPQRRSAWLAWWNGARLLAHRPWRTLLAGAAPLVVAAVAGSIALSLRLRVHQAGPARMAVAFLLAELAVAAVGWQRAARLIALADLMRADAADREQRRRLSVPAPSVT
ncbi:MAG TPA: hypothetical protein VG496_12715 [Myxococcales bacterium]|nr:hypothetical protein [Myxococcales bacterium]